jgi:hypothetical protein
MTIFRRKQLPTPPPFEPYRPPVQPPTQPAPVEPQLSPAQRQTYDWSGPDDRQQLPVRRVPTYVPSASDILPPPVITVANPDIGISSDIVPSSTVEARTMGSHSDRARAWIKYSQPLCIGVGAVATIAAIALRDVPILSFWTLIVFGLTYVISYSLLLPIYWLITPEGVALLQVRGLWSHLRREQKHRHELERAAHAQHERMLDDRRARRG